MINWIDKEYFFLLKKTFLISTFTFCRNSIHFYHFYVKYIGEVFLYIPISEKDFVACTWTIRKIVILYENVQALYLSGYTYIYVFTGYIVYVCSGYICIYSNTVHLQLEHQLNYLQYSTYMYILSITNIY